MLNYMQNNMQLLALLHLLVAIEARRRQLAPDRHFARPKIRRQTEPPAITYGLYNEPVPVDLIHVRKEGLVDPSTDQKEPYDALAASMRFRLPPGAKEKWIQEEHARKIHQIAPWTQRIDFDEGEELDIGNKPPKPFDLEKLQTINIAIPGAYSANIAKVKSLFRSGPSQQSNQTGDVYPTFDPSEVEPLDSFDKQFKDSSDNWTTCDEFAVGARFHPKEVAGVVWKLFYIWARGGFPDINRFDFQYPTKKLVYDFKEKYDKFMDVKIDWKQPMLLLKVWMELLLVAADRRGLFIAVPKIEIPDHANLTTFKVQHITVRMKMVNRYLGMMICEETIGLLLAAEGEVPPLRERPTAAAALGFRGHGTPVVPNSFRGMDLKKTQRERLEAESAVVDEEQPKFKPSPFFNYDQ